MTDNLNPFGLLKEEMDNDEVAIRVNAIHRLRTIVTVVGPDFFKTQILPYLEGLVRKEDDEVLFAIAEELGKISTLLSGNLLPLLPSLETLASVEETVVRDRAVISLTGISELMTDTEIQNSYIPLVLRLATNEWFTGRVSAVNLIDPIYPRGSAHKEKLRQKFIELCNEETPMVRRAVANRIGNLATVVTKDIVINELIPIFKQLSSDEQDSVKVLCLNSLKQIAKLLNKEENKTHTLPIIIAATEDKSWKIRLALAKNFAALAEAFGKEITDISLIQIFTTLLKDAETDVRIAAVQSLITFIKTISVDKLPILIPHIQTLARDNSNQVRSDICSVIAGIVPLLGKDVSYSKLFPYILELIEDKESSVRIACLRSFSHFASVLGPELMNSLVPHLKNLIEDKRWRVREATYDTLADLALLFQNVDVFTKQIEPLLFTFLKDRANTIRETGIKRLPNLIQVFKNTWFVNSCLPKLVESLNKQNTYLIRITGLYCLKAAAQSLPSEVVNDKILPILLKNGKDEVPNVRIVVVKIIKALILKFDSNVVSLQVKPLLQELSNDSDKDVQFYAQEAFIAI